VLLLLVNPGYCTATHTAVYHHGAAAVALCVISVHSRMDCGSVTAEQGAPFGNPKRERVRFFSVAEGMSRWLLPWC
jgi:hypothetical protein